MAAVLLAVGLLLANGRAIAGEPQEESGGTVDRTVGGRVRIQLPFLTGYHGDFDGWWGIAGGSAALTVLDWAEVEAGAVAVLTPTATGVQVLGRVGATPPIYDGRDATGAGLTLQGVGLVGYHFRSMEREARDSRPASTKAYHALGFDTGLELTYWVAERFGVGFQALFDLMVPVSPRTDTTDDVLLGYTARFGIAF